MSIRGGDGGYVAINPGNTSMLWVENTGPSMARSTNGGSSYSNLTSGITEASGNFAQNPSNAVNMWTGGARMQRFYP